MPKASSATAWGREGLGRGERVAAHLVAKPHISSSCRKIAHGR